MFFFSSAVGGDSGAWVIENARGRVCGHVLAWCARNRLAYICPMQVLLEDIKRTLGARKIYLPGSEEEEQQRRRQSQSQVIVGQSPTKSEMELGRGGGVGVGGRKNGFELPDIMSLDLSGKGEPEKENIPVLRSRLQDSPSRLEFLGGRTGQMAR